MGLVNQIEIKPLESTEAGMAHFFTPQSSHETMMVRVESGAIDHLFVHRFQTDQLFVVSGEMVFVILQNRQYQYIYLSERSPQVITIPPGIPHGAVNLSTHPCVVINAVLRHGEPHMRDYRPLKPPFPYDMAHLQSMFRHNLSSVV